MSEPNKYTGGGWWWLALIALSWLAGLGWAGLGWAAQHRTWSQELETLNPVTNQQQHRHTCT